MMKNKQINIIRLLIFFLPLVVLCSGATTAYATSATISVNGNEGAIPLAASATFSAYDGINYGKLYIYHNGTYMTSRSGNGSASWSTTLDGGTLAQGDHTYKARACDSNGTCKSSSQTITIDNTPGMTATLSGTEGEIIFTGTASFKEYVAGDDGYVKLYQDGYYRTLKYFDGAGSHPWNWREIIGIIDTGQLSQGEHTFKAVAWSRNGVSVSEEKSITVDNTPELTATLSGTEGEIKFTGTASFKECVTGDDGWVKFYQDGYYRTLKYFDGAGSLPWNWGEIVGIIDTGRLSQGEHTYKAVAYSRTGVSVSEEKSITVDNTPEVKVLEATYEDTSYFDIIGTATFKEHVGGFEGSLYIYIKETGKSYLKRGSKNYGEKNVNWKYSDITGHKLSQATWSGREITVKVVARAYNGTTAEDEKGIIIPALGCPIEF